jgi:hypothetical protein
MKTTKITEVATKVYKDRDNCWIAETIRTEKGQTFQITTSKTYSGSLRTYAMKVNARQGETFTSISFGMNDEFMSLSHGKLRVTEAVIRECHAKGLVKFDELVSTLPEAEIRNDIPEIGDILFLDGYGKTMGSRENKHIIYRIEETDWGTNYHCVEADTLVLTKQQYPKPFSKKFGIGTYFEKGYDAKSLGLTDNDIADMLIEAQEVMKKREEAFEKANEEARQKEAERQKYLSQFIRADVRKTTNIIKAHCRKVFDISGIKVSTESYSGGDSMSVQYTSPEPIKELESFINNFQYGHFNSMEDIYESTNDQDIVVDGHILQQYKYVFVDHVQGDGKQPDKPITPEQIEVVKPEWDKMQDFIKETDIKLKGFQIVDYSDKAIAVIGNTKPIKDLLKELGGRFNMYLSCGAGWIFPKAKRSEVEKLLLTA